MLENYHDLCTDDIVSRFISSVIIYVNIGTEYGRIEDGPPDSDIISTDPNASLSDFCFVSLYRDCRGYLCTGCFTIIHMHASGEQINVIRDKKINLNHTTKYIFDKILSNFLYKLPFIIFLQFQYFVIFN